MFIIFCSVCVAGWPPFGRWLLTWLAVFSHCVLAVCDFSYFPFRFRDLVWVIVGSVPGIFKLFYFL